MLSKTFASAPHDDIRPADNGVRTQMNASRPVQPPSGILFGAAYYAEYHREERTEADLDLMKQAGFTVIRVGESVWSTWEPRDGEFDLDWLQPVLDGAHERGIAVILGTPTYAVPPWLQTAYPEIAAERRTGERVPWGARQEVDYSHPAFRFHAERVIRAVDRPLRRPPRRDRLPGRQRARHGALPQPRRLPAVRAPAEGAVRRRRDAQPRVGPHLLVAPAVGLVRPLDARRQHAAPVRPGVAAVPGRPHHRVHRLAGRHRARVRPARAVRHHVHRLSRGRRSPTRSSSRRSTSPPATRTTPCRTTSTRRSTSSP